MFSYGTICDGDDIGGISFFLDAYKADLKFSFGFIYKPLNARFRIVLPKLVKALANQLKRWQVKASYDVMLMRSICLSACRIGHTLKSRLTTFRDCLAVFPTKTYRRWSSVNLPDTESWLSVIKH